MTRGALWQRALLCMSLALGAGTGCNVLLGYDAGEQAAGGTVAAGGTGAAGAGATGGVGGSGGAGAVAAAGGSAGFGGQGAQGGTAGSDCGNGTIEAGEQCDDANDQPGDGCHQCNVECVGNGETMHGTTYHCYLVSAAVAGWVPARSACQAWGGDLASLTTAEENGFVASLIGSQVWLGGHDMAVEGQYQWVSNEPWSYTAWDTAAGQPDGADSEDCVELHDDTGTWHDDDCSKLDVYVCERPPPEANP